MFNTNDPGVMWLVITNFAMGAVVLVCCLLLGGAVVRELIARTRKVTSAATADDHAFHLPELGLTMADGGEREDTPPKKTTTPNKR